MGRGRLRGCLENRALTPAQARALLPHAPTSHPHLGSQCCPLPSPLSQVLGARPPNGLVRKVKRTLPSPLQRRLTCPWLARLPPQLYAASLLQRGQAHRCPHHQGQPAPELDRDLRLVEHESTKLRKKQAGAGRGGEGDRRQAQVPGTGITQRKESLAKDRSGRDYPPLRGLSEHRDYLSDSELNQLRLQGCATPAGQYAEIPDCRCRRPYYSLWLRSSSAPRLPPPAPLWLLQAALGQLRTDLQPTRHPPTLVPAHTQHLLFLPVPVTPSEPGLPSQQAFVPRAIIQPIRPCQPHRPLLFPSPG